MDAAFEPPANPDVEVRTDLLSLAESVDRIIGHVVPLISMND